MTLSFEQLVGQTKAVARLKLIATATGRMQNVLILSPAGCGKTAFVEAFAREAGARLFRVNAVGLTDPGIGLNQSLRPAVQCDERAIIFIDESHDLKKKIQTALLTGMEHPYYVTTPIKMGRQTKSYRVTIPEHVSFAFASTDGGKIDKALLTRFARIHLDDYTQAEKEEIAHRYLKSRGFRIEPDARAGFARIARNIRMLIKDALDTAILYQNRMINMDIFRKVIDHLQLTSNGLTRLDTKLLNRLADNEFVSLRNLIAFLQIEKEEYERMEAWLIKNDYIGVSTHGRFISRKGLGEIGRSAKKNVLDLIGSLVDEDDDDS